MGAALHEIRRALRRSATDIDHDLVVGTGARNEIEDASVEVEFGQIISERRGVVLSDGGVRRANDTWIETATTHPHTLPDPAPCGETYRQISRCTAPEFELRGVA